MKPVILFIALVMSALSFSAHSQQVLEGDQRLACEATMCLLAGQRPDQCEPSIRRYFSISHRRPSDTLNGRMNFLRLCPRSDDSMVQAVAMGAGSCEAENLNTLLLVITMNGDSGGQSYISNVAPDFCGTFYTLQGLTAETMPRYVGTPETAGYWVPGPQYAAEYQAYLARQAALPVYDYSISGY